MDIVSYAIGKAAGGGSGGTGFSMYLDMNSYDFEHAPQFTYLNKSYFKISNLVLDSAAMIGGVAAMSDGAGFYANASSVMNSGGLTICGDMQNFIFYVISAEAGSYGGGAVVIPESGTYFMGDMNSGTLTTAFANGGY